MAFHTLVGDDVEREISEQRLSQFFRSNARAYFLDAILLGASNPLQSANGRDLLGYDSSKLLPCPSSHELATMSQSNSHSTLYSPQEYVDHFHAAHYLREYYSMEELGGADTAIAKEASCWLARQDREYSTAIDVGCGPVLEYPFIFAPRVAKYDLADYLPANLHNIHLWLERQSGAHNWDPLFRGVLRTQSVEPDEQLTARAEKLRQSVHALRHIDLFQEYPLGEAIQYDLVTSFFCTECVGCNATDWRTLKTKLIDLVAPGGSFFLAVMRGCHRYQVLGKWFP